MKTKGVAVGLLVLGLSLLGTVGPGPAVAAEEEQPAPPEGMAYIPAGSFLMGDSFGEGSSRERPVHTAYVSAFYMDKYEVTKALWDEVATWAQANGYDIGPADGDGKAPDHPVYNVSWYEAVKWATARFEKEGRTPCYYMDDSFTTVYRAGLVDVANEWVKWTADGYRLPTEAEWEKAARGGEEGRRFPWADTDTIQHARANYFSSSDHSYDTSLTRGHHPTYGTGDYPYTSPVGSFAPNGYGLYDMAGNMWEWCWDRYGETYYASSPGTDPRGPGSGSFRVGRGGGGFYFASGCRVAFRLRRRARQRGLRPGVPPREDSAVAFPSCAEAQEVDDGARPESLAVASLAHLVSVPRERCQSGGAVAGSAGAALG